MIKRQVSTHAKGKMSTARSIWLWLVLALVAMCGVHAFAQTTGTLSGTVTDQTGAVIPGAKVTLLNQATHDARTTVSNGSGYFTFAGITPNVYTVSVSAANFESWQKTNITVNPGDIRQVDDIKLAVGSSSNTVTVETIPGAIEPVDSGERSALLTSKDIQRLSIESRNISELLKILPGVTSTANGTGNGLGFDFTNAGATGSTVGVGLSTNGAPYRGGTSYLLDGANILDPGCNCWSMAVANPDMTQEVKVQTSNFGADSPNGPVVVNTISKSGSDKFHGEAYLYARNSVLNSNTWANNHNNSPRQDAQYYYPGGNFGGPVKIPGTDFNHNNKLFFWAGYEYFWQKLPASSPLESYVPSDGMQSGNFTASGAGNNALCPSGFSPGATNWCNDLTGTVAPDGTAITGGVIPSQYMDAGGTALLKLFPKANANPTTTPGGYNYYEPITTQHNGYIYRFRVDYNFSDNDKLFVTYQYGTDTGVQPAHMYWNPNYIVPYPAGNIVNPTKSRVLTLNYLHIFGASLTNDFVAAWAKDTSPYSVSNLTSMYKSTIGYPYATAYNNGAQVAPSINSPGSQTFPDLSQPDLFEDGGSYPLIKATPSFSDDVTYVYRNHTFKFGAYTLLAGNLQGTWGYVNGDLNFNGGLLPDVGTGQNIGSNNPFANMLLGISNGGSNGSGFNQNSANPITDMAYRTTSAYVMDTWKVKPRLTLNLGIRFDHVGRWYDRQGTGMAVWLPGRVASDMGAGKEYPGVYWHGIDPGVPVSGSPARTAFTSPRLGGAWDLFGNGKTVLRGGWGAYRWNDQYNDYAGALQTAQGARTYYSPTGYAMTLKEIGALSSSNSSLGSVASSVYAADPNDHEIPLTYAYNFTVSQQLPWNSLLEVAYVGNNSNKLLMGGQSDGSGIGGSGFTNVNKIPLGGLFKPDPVTGAAAPSNPDDTSSYNIVDYYPYQAAYGTNSIHVGEHIGYSNYNGLQVSWVKQTGHLSYNINYTWSKSLGIVGSTVDAFSVHGNYGILNIDRPHVINTSYAYDLGNLYHGGFKLLGGATNGWTVSGTTTWQAGGNLQALYSQNLGMTLNYKDPNTGALSPLSSNTYFGTPSQEILPVLTCDPKSGLKTNQKVNINCFAPPAIGQQGVRQAPYLSGPSYFNSDLAIYKTFHITENQNVQFRFSGFNFLNHPLWAFSTNNDLQLKYTTPGKGGTFTQNVASGLPAGYTWGSVDTKTGTRILELALKYSF